MFQQPFVFAVLQFPMFVIDAEKMAPGLNQIVGNEGIQDSEIVYI